MLTLVLYFHLPNMFKRFVTPKVTAVLNPRIRLVTLELYFHITYDVKTLCDPSLSQKCIFICPVERRSVI